MVDAFLKFKSASTTKKREWLTRFCDVREDCNFMWIFVSAKSIARTRGRPRARASARAGAMGTCKNKRGGASPDKVTDLDGSERVGYAVAVYCRCIVSVCFASHREADSNQSVVARNIRHLRRHRNRRHQSLQ